MQQYIKVPLCSFRDRNSSLGANDLESRELVYLPAARDDGKLQKDGGDFNNRQLSRLVSVLRSKDISKFRLFLLNDGFDVNRNSRDGLTALFQAVR